MKSEDKVKILFFSIIKRNWLNSKEAPNEEIPFYEISDVLKDMMKLSKKDRFMDIKRDKFCFLDFYNLHETTDDHIIINGTFKSARNEFRPNLIDKRNGNERENPKSMTEGDVEKTHFVLKINKKGNVDFFLESNFHGITIKEIIKYFSKFTSDFFRKYKLKKTFSVKYQNVVKKGFLEELKKMDRATLAEIYIDKKIMGSEYLKLSKRLTSIRKEIKLEVKADIRENIKDFAVDLFNYYKKDEEIVSIRITGQDDDGNPTIVNTETFNKVEYIEAELDSNTGEVKSNDFFKQALEMVKKL